MTPAATKKKVIVVGGGPAGLETARVAAERGHQVMLFEREGQLGGLVNVAARGPSQELLLDFVRWERLQLQKLRVDVRLNTEATEESVLAVKPEAVVVATGSRPRRPDIAGIDQSNVVELRDVMLDRATVGDKVMVIAQEDHLQALSCANYLARRGKKVELLCQTVQPAPKVGRYTQGAFYQQLQSNGVKFTIMTRAKAIRGNTILTQKVFSGDEELIDGFDTFVLACGGEGETSLYRRLKGRATELYIIGDAYAPRRIAEATQQAAAVGRML